MRKGANAWTHFRVTLQLYISMKTLAIVLVGGAAKIAAVAFAPIYKAKGPHQNKNKIVFPSTPVEATWKDEWSGLLLPCCGVNGAI